MMDADMPLCFNGESRRDSRAMDGRRAVEHSLVFVPGWLRPYLCIRWRCLPTEQRRTPVITAVEEPGPTSAIPRSDFADLRRASMRDCRTDELSADHDKAIGVAETRSDRDRVEGHWAYCVHHLLRDAGEEDAKQMLQARLSRTAAYGPRR